MPRFEKRSKVNATPEEVFDWHSRPGAFDRLSPPWQRVESSQPTDGIRVGSRVSLRLGRKPFAIPWVAEHTAVQAGRGFEDVQVVGPFRSWRHQHLFDAAPDGLCWLRDRIDYEIPVGSWGERLAGIPIRRSLEKTFEYRHQTTIEDLDLHARYTGGSYLRIAITGATGLIGTTLTAVLSTGGHEVIRFTRDPETGSREDLVLWDPRRGILQPEKLRDVDAVIHLAGEDISRGRWTRRKRRRIRQSRVTGTRNLVSSLAKLDTPPRTLISASAIGFYGDGSDAGLTEASPRGQGFLAEVCEEWEGAAAESASWGTRVVFARLGMVLSPRGGALGRMLPAFRLGGGGKIGSGNQYMSWISIDDVAGALMHVLRTPELDGPVNLVAPQPLSNRRFVHELATLLRRPAIVPLPATLARLLFGQMAGEVLLVGNEVLPEKLRATGYRFRHPDLQRTLAILLGRQ